jgi:hypothetical protein
MLFMWNLAVLVFGLCLNESQVLQNFIPGNETFAATQLSQVCIPLSVAKVFYFYKFKLYSFYCPISENEIFFESVNNSHLNFILVKTFI